MTYILKYFVMLCAPMLAVMFVSYPVEAQVRANNRVNPANRTIVGKNRATNTLQIRGGARRGNNLFHTFSEFRPSKNVDFIVQPSINNVFALVRGRRSTRITSSLSLVEQISGGPHNANFYLINPRGITLDPGAFLNVSGDLVLSTANSIGFGSQGRLALTSAPSIPLLTANPSDFAFRRNSNGAINVNNGFLGDMPDPTDSSTTSLIASSINITNSFVIGNRGLALGALRQGRFFTDALNNRGIVSPTATGGDITLESSQGFSFSSIDVLADGNLTLGSGSDIVIPDSDIASLEEGDIRIAVAGNIQLEPAEIFSNTISNARGDIDIQTSKLQIGENSSINLTAVQNLPEAAGDISIVATESIEIDGLNSTILASTLVSVDEEATGDTVDISTFTGTNNDAGNISITTPFLSLTNNASIRVSSGDGMGLPGDLRINAQTVVLDRGELTAATGNLQGPNSPQGNIFLNVSDAITLRNSSLITALASGNSSGGNIFILNTPILRSVQGSDPLGTGNDIIADSSGGPGGNIIINTQGEPIGFNAPSFGVASNQTNTSDTNEITAQEEASEDIGDPSNEDGTIIDDGRLFDGENTITATGIDPGFIDIDPLTEVNQGDVELPRVVIDPDSLIAQNSCNRGSESEFTLSGQGGLAANVTQSLDVIQSQVSPIQLPTGAESISDDTDIVKQTDELSSSPRDLNQMAQGWVYDPSGKIKLIAYKNEVTPDNTRQIKKAC